VVDFIHAAIVCLAEEDGRLAGHVDPHAGHRCGASLGGGK
jgi:hypothetical protein